MGDRERILRAMRRDLLPEGWVPSETISTYADEKRRYEETTEWCFVRNDAEFSLRVEPCSKSLVLTVVQEPAWLERQWHGVTARLGF